MTYPLCSPHPTPYCRLRNVLNEASPGSPLIPELLYSFYQLQFAAVTVGILMGGVAERGRVLPAMIFAFIWATLVYSPVACWVSWSGLSSRRDAC